MTGHIPTTFIHELLNQTNLIDLIEKRITLKKAAGRFVAKCPFHQEKTASFYVDPHKQFYYCFGCHAHGNAIGFLMAYERLPFIEAVENLAASLGLSIPSENASISSKKNVPDHYANLYALMEKTASFYQKCLLKSPEALQYLAERKISKKMIETFKLGFAPNKWDTLTQKISGQSDLLAQMHQVGMLCKKSNEFGYYDRFRNRVMFPIHNTQGKIIAFGARAIDAQTPKYLNTPETLLYHKGNELYGLNRIKKSKQILIVEGYIDVITLNQAGIDFAVAPLGTAITKKQIQIVLRYTSEIIFCFDSDSAGQKAAWRALEILLPLMKDNIHASFLTLPPSEDPDSYIQKNGAKAFEKALQSTTSLSDFFFKTLQAPYDLNTIHGKTHFAKLAKQLLNTLPNCLFKQLMLEKLAQLIHVSTEKLIEQETPFSPAPSPTLLKTPSRKNQIKNKAPSALRTAITLLIQKPSLVEHIPNLDMIKEIQLPGITLLQELIQLTQTYTQLSTGALLEHFREKPNQQRQLAKLAFEPILISSEDIKSEFLGAIKCLEQQGINETIKQLLKQHSVKPLSVAEQAMLQKLIAYSKIG